MAPAGRTTADLVTGLSEQDAEGGVIPRFHTVVRARAQAVAAVDGRRKVTFGGLARQAGLVHGAVRSVPGTGAVALLHGHDPGALGAVLGILSTGRPLVVLDPRSPAPRLRQLLNRARAGVCVTDEAHAALAAAAAPRTLVTERLVPHADSLDQMWAAPPDPARPAVLAFTSGTTGRPKIVANDHRMLVRDAWANAIATGCYGPDDVVAHALPIAFHAGLMAALAGVLVGASLRFVDPRATGPHELAGWLAATGATVVHLSPATARALVAARPDPAGLAGLRAVTVAGEPFYGQDAAALRALLAPECVIHHRYGSSETGLIASQPLRADDALPHGALPVGTAVGDWRITLVGTDGTPVPDGEPGVVTVTGRHLGSGYWDDPEATATAFDRSAADGTTTYRSNDLGRLDGAGRLLLLGRQDFSVKIGEYLVEPGEVDAALFELTEVREAVTVGAVGEDGTSRLSAYVVPGSPDVTADGVAVALAALLPPHMVPEAITLLDALPRTERGKIDRSQLPPPPP